MNNQSLVPVTTTNLIFNNLITVKELCEFLKFKPKTVYNWIHREPDFPYRKLGKVVRFELSKVVNWLEGRS